MKKENIICVVGPTASGKTELAINIAKTLDTEIISADSMQIYKEFNIGVAKPSHQEMQGIKHYMLGIKSINDEYSVSEYVKEGSIHIKDIIARKKIPLIVGGTGLYINALMQGNTFSGAEADIAFRKEMEEIAKKYGNIYLHNMLKECDKISAQKIHPNNVIRVIRALEIYHQTGRPMSEVVRVQSDKYNVIMLGLCPEKREVLYDRINTRVDIMMNAGLIKEAKNIYGQNISLSANSAIGYKELFDYFDNKCSLDESIDKIKQNTRNYAKRQLTWFRQDKRINWMFYNENEKKINLLQNSTNFISKSIII